MLECTDRQRQHKGPLTTMSFPWYARSIVKYKSPHPQDLSFPKDQDLRVLGYADRGAEEEEAEEEDDRWYVGEWLDGSRQGQFPASLVVRINSEEVDVPHSPAMPAAEPISPPKDISSENASSVAPEHVQEKTPMNAEEPQEKVPVEGVQEFVHKEASGSAEQPQEKVDVEEVTPQPEVTGMLPIEQPVVQTHTEQMPQDSERGAPVPREDFAEPVQERAPAPIKPSLSESVPETQASATMPSHSPEDTPVGPAQGHAAPSSTADPQAAEPSIDPSAMSLRDRIAAFNKPVEKGPPPPLPRGKPGGWKRPVPVHVAPKHVDARTDAAPSTMSASDAQSSIKMSLKERMSALQRNEEAISRPTLTTERQTPSKLTNPLPTEPSGEDAEHRASIARRMAALGGRRVEPGLFGILPKAEASKQKDQQDVDQKEASEQDASEKAESQDSQTAVASTGEAPLVVPRRPVAPRTRRIKPAQETAKGPENSEVHHSTERQIPASESATDPPAPMDGGASTVESPASCKAGEECPDGVLVMHKEPGEAPAAHNEQLSTLEGEVSNEFSVPARDTTESCVPAQQEAQTLPASDLLSTKPTLSSSEAPCKTEQDVQCASLTGSVDKPDVEPESQVSKTVVPPIQEQEDTPLASEHDVYTGMETVPAEQPMIPSPSDPIEHIAYAMSTMPTRNGVTEDSDQDFAEQHALLEHLLQHPGETSSIRQEPVSCLEERTSPAPPLIMGMPMPPRRSTHDNISPLSPMGHDTPSSHTSSPVHTETAPSARMPPRPTRRAPTLPVLEDSLTSPPNKPGLPSNIIDVPIPNSDTRTEEATSPSSAVPDRPKRAPPRAPSSETAS